MLLWVVGIRNTMSFDTRKHESDKKAGSITSHENRRLDTQLRAAISKMQTFLFDPDAGKHMIESACEHITKLTESAQTVCYVADDHAKCLLSESDTYEMLGLENRVESLPKESLDALLLNKGFFQQTQVFNHDIPASLIPLLAFHSDASAAMFIPIYVNHELRALIVSTKLADQFSSAQIERVKPVVGSLICSLRSVEAVIGNQNSFQDSISGNQFLNSLMATSPAAILVLNEQLSVIVANQNAERFFAGFTGSELFQSYKKSLVGMPIENYLPHYRDLFLWSQQEDKYGIGEDLKYHAVFREQQAFKSDGQESLVDITPFRYSNGFETFTVLQILETTHQNYSRELEQSEQNHLLAIRHLIPIAVLKVDLNWRCVFANDRWLEESGLSEDESVGYGWSSAFLEGDRTRLFSELKKCINSGHEYRQDIQIVSPLGGIKWCELNAQISLNEHQELDAFLITLTDITSRINYQEKLRKVAEYDPLTGLVNRNLLLDRLQQAFYVAEREKSLVCVMFLDLDGFKLINDKLGHDIGDELLKQVATRLKKTLRKNDTVARFGGDEFVVLLGHDDHPTTFSSVAEKLIAAISKTFNLKENEVNITTSIGIATGLAAEVTPNTLVKQADAALYLAKRQGKNKYELFDKRLNGEYKQRSFLASQLKRGIAQNNFSLSHQLITSLKFEDVESSVAFLRFKDVNDNELLPDDFMQVLLQTGDIYPVVQWVFEDMCRKLMLASSAVEHTRDFSISISLPLAILLSEDLPDSIRKATKASGVNPESIVLRVDESVLSNNKDTLVPALVKLKTSRVKLALDNFGIDNAALNLIPIGLFCKIFVCESLINEAHKQNTKIIIGAITALAKANGITTIAKLYKNTPQNALLLKELGFDCMQDISCVPNQDLVQQISQFNQS